jgi:hypothetical protein
VAVISEAVFIKDWLTFAIFTFLCWDQFMHLDFYEGFRRIKLIFQVTAFLSIPLFLFYGWDQNKVEKIVSMYEFVPDNPSVKSTGEQVVTVDQEKYNYETHKFEPKTYTFPKDASRDEINRFFWWNHFWQNVRIFFEIIGCSLLFVFSLEVVFRLFVWVLKGFAPKQSTK